MKISAFIILVLLITFNTANGQEKEKPFAQPVHLSFGTNFGLPIGEKTSSAIKFVFGGNLQLVYRAASKLDLTGSGGFDIWHHGKGMNYNYVPLLGGFRYYLSEKAYLSEQAGYSIILPNDASAENAIKGAFTDIAGIGFETGQNSDLLLAYKGLFYSGATRSTINLRISYRFGK